LRKKRLWGTGGRSAVLELPNCWSSRIFLIIGGKPNREIRKGKRKKEKKKKKEKKI
jgi:hypothetical protein